LLVGSFLNVVIYRVPKMMQRESDNYVANEMGKDLPHTDNFNLMVPRSCCPHCGHQITALENIPVISYLALRGKCSACKAPIAARYPAIETVSAVLTGLLAWHFGTGALGLATFVFGWILLALTMIDFDTQLLPDDLTYPLLWLGLLVNLDGGLVPIKDAVIGAAAGYMILWSIYWLFKLATGKEGMGYGDFKLLAALGAWLGWTMLPTIVLLSSVVGALVGISLILFAKHGRGKPIPFGPYLAAAGMIAMLFGEPIARATSGFLGQP
jgi:leader peptidase (prepilin peptidase)/N-methyltransferase